MKGTEDFLHNARGVVSKTLKSQSHGYYITALTVTDKLQQLNVWDIIHQNKKVLQVLPILETRKQL